MLLVLLALGCEYTPEELCAGKGPESMLLGHSGFDEWVPMETGDEVLIATPPQGGFGVIIRGRTRGLVAGQPISLDLSTWWQGESIGDYSLDGMPLYCDEEGNGVFYGTGTPIDHPDFVTDEDLEVLAGETVGLRVLATDVEGDQAEGSVEVVLGLRE